MARPRAECDNALASGKPVIPVLLPSAPNDEPDLPLFLRNRTWVDLRGEFVDDGLDTLEWGITGNKPHATRHVDRVSEPTAQRRVQLDWLAALLGKQRQRPLAKDRLDRARGVAVPLVVSGAEVEWHEALARQLKAQITDYDPNGKPLTVPGWHDNADLELRKQNLLNNLRGQLQLDPLPDDYAIKKAPVRAEIGAKMDRVGNEVIHYWMSVEQWTDTDPDLLRWWLDFWLDLKLPERGQKVCALLSIETPKPAGLLGRLLRRGAGAEKAAAVLDALRQDPRYAPCILPTLESPTRACAHEWDKAQLTRVPDIEHERSTYVAACHAVFAAHEAIPHETFRQAWKAEVKNANIG